MATITVPSEYGYVILVGVGSSLMLIWKSMKVNLFGIEIKYLVHVFHVEEQLN